MARSGGGRAKGYDLANTRSTTNTPTIEDEHEDGVASNAHKTIINYKSIILTFSL